MTNDEINKALGIEPLEQNAQSEEDIILHIEERVNVLLSKDPRLLFSYMYRLDVLEEKIKFALDYEKTTPTATALAKLIWERQKQRLALRKKYTSTPIDDELAW